MKVRSAFDADVTVATYAFFADDRRASRTVTNRGGLNGVTYYFYDGHEVIEERDGSGAVVHQYLFGPQHIDELLLTLGENGANWVHQDANWNIIGTTTSTGQVAERYTYDPYGRLRARRLTGFGDTDADGLVGTKDIADWEATQGEGGVYDRKLDANLDGVNDAYDASAFDKMVSLPGGRLTVPNRRMSPSEQWAGYTARTLDPESGLMHYRRRAYSPELRRFGQRDPIEYAGGGPNLYGYVDGNPWKYVDPFGEHGLGDSPSLDARNEAIVALPNEQKAGLAVAGGCSVAAGGALVGAAAVASGPMAGIAAIYARYGWKGVATVIGLAGGIGLTGKPPVGLGGAGAAGAAGAGKAKGKGGRSGGSGAGGGAGGGAGATGGTPAPPPPPKPNSSVVKGIKEGGRSGALGTLNAAQIAELEKNIAALYFKFQQGIYFRSKGGLAHLKHILKTDSRFQFVDQLTGPAKAMYDEMMAATGP